METGRYIYAPASVRRRVREELGISHPTMVAALSYKRSGESSTRARELALELGAVKMISLPECETVHDVNGYMRQIFENEHLLVIDKATGCYKVYDKPAECLGNVVLQGKISNLDMLGKIQQIVANL